MKKVQGPKSSLPTPEGLGLHLVPIGEIVGAFGLKGWIKVRPLTEFAERFDPGKTVYLDDEPLKVQQLGWKETQVRLKFDGIETVEAAEELIGRQLFAVREEHPELEEDEYYTADLLGLDVKLPDGTLLGKVDEVLAAPAQDVLRVGDVLIPMVKAFVKTVSLDKRLIIVELIPGMLPSEQGEN